MNQSIFKSQKFQLFIAITLIIGYMVLATQVHGFNGDRAYWARWAWYAKENGLSNIYGTDTNYLPFYLYFVAGFGSFFGSEEAIFSAMHYMRYFTFLFDIGGVYFVCRFLSPQYRFISLLLFSLFNIAYYYNSLVWGQVDALLGFFAISSLYFLWKEKYLLGSVMLALLLSFKLQGIVFVPVFGLYFLAQLPPGKWLSKLGVCILAFTGVLVLVCLPFLTDKAHFEGMKRAVTGLVDYYPFITMGAANFWSIFFNLRADQLMDSERLIGALTYKQVGLIMFFTGSFIALWPLLKIIAFNYTHRLAPKKLSVEKLMLIASLIGLLFFLVNTQIHERYSHPVFVFLMAYSFLKRDFLPYILFSLAYLLNMESLLKAVNMEIYDNVLFERYFSGILYVMVAALLFYRLYRKEKGVALSQPFNQN